MYDQKCLNAMKCDKYCRFQKKTCSDQHNCKNTPDFLRSNCALIFFWYFFVTLKLCNKHQESNYIFIQINIIYILLSLLFSQMYRNFNLQFYSYFFHHFCWKISQILLHQVQLIAYWNLYLVLYLRAVIVIIRSSRIGIEEGQLSFPYYFYPL